MEESLHDKNHEFRKVKIKEASGWVQKSVHWQLEKEKHPQFGEENGTEFLGACK